MITNLAEFKKQLIQGRGGVALFIKERSTLPAKYRNALLHACLNDLRFDHQCERSRGDYLYRLIEVTGEMEFYRARILAKLKRMRVTEDNQYDLLQLMELTRLFAQNGDAEARDALYATFEKHAARGNLYGGDEIVMLDGIEGLLYLVDRHDDETNGYELSNFDWKLSQIEERDGEEVIQQELELKCALNPSHSAWLTRLRNYRDEFKRNSSNYKERPRQTYEDFRQSIKAKGGRIRNGRGWAKHALKSEIEQAADDLMKETDPNWLVPLLCVFHEIQFPRDPACLFRWAENEEMQISWRARTALANLKLPEVRAYALNALSQPDKLSAAVKMLNINYESGDEAIVANLVNLDMEPNYYHHLGMAARDFEKEHPSEFSTQIMELLYENNPCSFCRGIYVERLLELDSLPDWIRREVLHDAVDETRKLLKV